MGVGMPKIIKPNNDGDRGMTGDIWVERDGNAYEAYLEMRVETIGSFDPPFFYGKDTKEALEGLKKMILKEIKWLELRVQLINEENKND